ncbi:AAA family ATPase [Kribbella soli]|uniref:DNA repair protein RadA n=1 Tax=Kribbella soli TaxID=1124743 RepID=A0A4R0HLZ2_9ACTN|nr:AAA family ATPase [Kribbella soli]TCC10910.1 DNA repair protein RadA [Kribbella soli]
MTAASSGHLDRFGQVIYPEWPPPLEPPDDPRAEPSRPTHVDPFANAWTADRLMAEEFAPPRWAVPGLIPEGLSLLAGAPKAGKSWLSLNLALGIAAGTPVLGEVSVDPGEVLYLALEDTPRRLQSRMGKILGDRPAPAGLTLLTEFPTLPAGGANAIRGWLSGRRNARMVVIDVFAKIRGASPTGVNPYDADYAAMGRAKRIADDYGIAVVLVHHLRKMGADDFTAELSGTNGIVGAADTIMALKRPRGEADGVLHITGRDVDEAERAMRFDPDTGTWSLLAGAAVDHTLHHSRAAILAYVRQAPGATPKAISDALGGDRESVRKTCGRMADDGQLRRRDGGRYYPPDTATVPAVPESQNPA